MTLAREREGFDRATAAAAEASAAVPAMTAATPTAVMVPPPAVDVGEGRDGLDSSDRQQQSFPSTMSIYLRVAEAIEEGGLSEVDTPIGSPNTATATQQQKEGGTENPENPENPQAAENVARHEEAPRASGDWCSEPGSSTSGMERAGANSRAAPMRSERRPSGSTPAPIKRQAAMSDLWQQQGAFRSNRHSMRRMFEEVRGV